MALEGKVALVTGASRGIGAAIFDRLAVSGATVVGTATGENGLQEIRNRLESSGVSGGAVKLDLSGDPSELSSSYDSIVADYGDIDVLVNNAGITKDTLLMRMGDDAWSDVMRVNLEGSFRMSRFVLRAMMKKRWGRIVNISSVVGAMGNAGQTNYAASKAGLEGFSRALAREVASRGVTVNVVAPGFIDTEMSREIPESIKEHLLKNIPLGKLGEPSDVAEAVAYLASPVASYVTGHTLHVNGGLLMD